MNCWWKGIIRILKSLLGDQVSFTVIFIPLRPPTSPLPLLTAMNNGWSFESFRRLSPEFEPYHPVTRKKVFFKMMKTTKY